MRQPAPPYRGEGPHALWHVSENPAIARFVPHVSATAASSEPRVWAIDTRHLPLYWFPRECPRGTFWATAETTPADAVLLAGTRRVHTVEESWVERMRSTRVVAYRLPEASFAPAPDVGGYWLSRETGGIELRVDDNLWPTWNRVVSSTLEYSGIRLHNAAPPPS